MLSILIVNWNTREYLRACLSSLTDACRLEHEIIVVDCASADGSAQMVSTHFPEVRLFASEVNLGFARGNNLAFEHARGEWIWLLNPDTEIPPDAPHKLIEFLKSDPKRGAVASALIDARTKKPQRSCRTFPTPRALWVEALGLARKFPRSKTFGFYRLGWWNYRSPRQVEQPMASSFLMRRAAIEDIGYLFDEDFPIYFNDVDLCWRLKQKDWQIWYLPEARVLHHGGASTSQRKPEMILESHRSLKLFYQKHFRGRISEPVFFLTVLLVSVSGIARLWSLRLKSGIIHSLHFQ